MSETEKGRTAAAAAAAKETEMTKEMMIRSGYSEEEAEAAMSNPYAGLIFGCELPGEAATTHGDLMAGWDGRS